ncbi:response regulator [Larkinella insperata]|uniref:Response regulator n=1 Tax=Larkinella insperata TaxID=332158 RepID=A0ABW3Q5X7_9BACT|nr:response regulator [Larkinella insperata]
MENSESHNSLPRLAQKRLVGINPSLYIIDDNDDNLFLYEWIFTRYLPDYALHLFSDGLFVRQSQDSSRPKPDLILLDLKMPHISGFELLNELKQNPGWQHIPVVVFTNSTSPKDEEDCYKAGASAFVQKAFSVNTIKAQLEEICQRWLGKKRLPL